MNRISFEFAITPHQSLRMYSVLWIGVCSLACLHHVTDVFMDARAVQDKWMNRYIKTPLRWGSLLGISGSDEKTPKSFLWVKVTFQWEYHANELLLADYVRVCFSMFRLQNITFCLKNPGSVTLNPEEKICCSHLSFLCLIRNVSSSVLKITKVWPVSPEPPPSGAMRSRRPE